MAMVNSRPDLMNLSFSGCGFLCVYHAGVAAAVKIYAPQLIRNKVLGASAGSIVACGLICDVCISHATSTILKVFAQARTRALGPLHPGFDLLGIVREEIVKTLPKDAYKLCTGRLIISLTRWSDHENVMVDEYSSNDDLIDAIMCSCFIPIYCGITPPKFRGVQYIDGGVSDNQPVYDQHTITVSPFSGESDICPLDWDSASILGWDFNGTSIRFTDRNMFRLMMCLWPRSTEDLSKMCYQGFEDALRFLTKNGLSPCIRCLTLEKTFDKGVETLSELEGRVMSPVLSRRRKQSSSRIRGESECDTCSTSDHMFPAELSSVFPSIMKKPFDEAVAAEGSMFQTIFSFRILRFARTALGLSKLPLDVFFVVGKNIIAYLAIVSPPVWLFNRLRGLLEFVTSEADKQKSRYTKFCCHVALTEMERIGSSPQVDEKETEIELSEEARKELELLQERDRRIKNKVKKPSVVSVLSDNVYDDDSFSHVVEFSKNHDAMYEFHYLDENNKMRSVSMFNVLPNPDSLSRQASVRQRGVMAVPEEEEEAMLDCSSPKSNGDEMDSGVDSAQPPKKGSPNSNRRDACCSPVRHLSHTFSGSTPTASAPRVKGVQRRHTMTSTAPQNTRKQTFMKSIPRVLSSDSEVDGAEKFFVPCRRAYRASNEYDGEASDADQTA